MKKQVLLLPTMILMCFTLLNAANPTADHLIVRLEKGVAANTIQVQAANLQKIRTQVAIQDLTGKIWYSEYIVKEKGYAKNLKLDGMPEGQYVVFVKNNKGQVARAFRYAAGEVTFFANSTPKPGQSSIVFGSGEAPKYIARIAAAGAQSLRVQLTNLDSRGALIRLCGLGGNLVLEQTITDHSGVAKSLDLTGLAAGIYFLQLQAGGATLVQHLELTSTQIQLGDLEQAPAAGRSEMAKN